MGTEAAATLFIRSVAARVSLFNRSVAARVSLFIRSVAAMADARMLSMDGLETGIAAVRPDIAEVAEAIHPPPHEPHELDSAGAGEVVGAVAGRCFCGADSGERRSSMVFFDAAVSATAIAPRVRRCASLGQGAEPLEISKQLALLQARAGQQRVAADRRSRLG
tara:strand:- start:233 stop:724 length:492 start_codon:yes stop_codon:yes gene_type:complete